MVSDSDTDTCNVGSIGWPIAICRPYRAEQLARAVSAALGKDWSSAYPSAALAAARICSSVNGLVMMREILPLR